MLSLQRCDDPSKQDKVFADCSGSYHNRNPLFMRSMLFLDQSYKPKQTVAFPRNVTRSFHQGTAEHERLIAVLFRLP